MLINGKDNTNAHVKFVDYTGRYPNLCSGTLTLEIDGTEYIFGKMYNSPKPDFEVFWSSGGNVWFDDKWNEHVESEEWLIYEEDLPEQFRKYAYEIDRVFNENVKFGCCGGCV